MKVREDFYKWYKEMMDSDAYCLREKNYQLIAVRVLQQGFGWGYDEEALDSGLSTTKSDDDLRDYIYDNKDELVKAILDDDIEYKELSYFVYKNTIDYIDAFGCQHIKKMWARKNLLTVTISFYDVGENPDSSFEFTIDDLKKYGLNDDELFTILEVEQ